MSNLDPFNIGRQTAQQAQEQLQREANAHHRAMMAAQAAINEQSRKAAEAATMAAEAQQTYWRRRLEIDEETAQDAQQAHEMETAYWRRKIQTAENP